MPRKPAAAIAEKIRVRRAAAAERMRRSRSRRAKGLRCYTLEMRDSEIAALVRRGLLAPGERANRAAIIKAMYEFLDRTLERSV
jgi:hypothetical protein